MSLWEVVLSEFSVTNDEFWFEWTLPRLLLLVEARVQRNAESEDRHKNKEPQTSSLEDMEYFMKDGQF